MAWKTLHIEIGEKHGLDAPNDKLWVKAVPMMWLPGSVSSKIIGRINADEAKVKTVGEDSEDAIKIRMDGLYEIFPDMVSSWNLVDPESNKSMPAPKQLEDPSYVRSLPVQIIQEVCDACINYGVDKDEPVVALVPADDPDAGDTTAQTIPLENDGGSGQLSLVAAGQTEPSSSNGNSSS